MSFNFGGFMRGMSESIVSSIEEEEKQLLKKAILKLNKKEQKIVGLYRLGLKYEEMAEDRECLYSFYRQDHG